MTRAFIVAALILSGCSTDRIDTLAKPSESKSYPDMMSRPDADNRRAIMSGDRPDWKVGDRHGARVRVIDW